MRPSGPLPSRTYWVRRLVLVFVITALVCLVWWFVAGPGGADESTAGNSTSEGGASAADAANAGPDPSSATVSEEEKQGASDPPRKEHEGDKAQGNAGEGPALHRGRGEPGRNSLAEPTGDCEVEDVSLKIQVSDATRGEGTPARLKFTSLAEPACTLGLTADTLALRVTSGSDTVWTSQQCPDAVLAQQLVVRADKATVYAFDWDGRRSVETCQSPGDVAAAGGYWMEAALVGAEIEKAYFEVA